MQFGYGRASKQMIIKISKYKRQYAIHTTLKGVSMKKIKIPKPQPSKADPLGQYTGVPIDGGTPTQDADDL